MRKYTCHCLECAVEQKHKQINFITVHFVPLSAHAKYNINACVTFVIYLNYVSMSNVYIHSVHMSVTILSVVLMFRCTMKLEVYMRSVNYGRRRLVYL